MGNKTKLNGILTHEYKISYIGEEKGVNYDLEVVGEEGVTKIWFLSFWSPSNVRNLLPSALKLTYFRLESDVEGFEKGLKSCTGSVDLGVLL